MLKFQKLQDKYNTWELYSKNIIFHHFTFCEHLNFHAQMSWAWKRLYNLEPDYDFIYFSDVNVTMNVVNPGVTKTGIHRYMPFRQSAFIGLTFTPFIWFLMKAPEDGAQPAIFCSVAEALTNVSGEYYR